jgi:acyl transferase domain-containing protein
LRSFYPQAQHLVGLHVPMSQLHEALETPERIEHVLWVAPAGALHSVLQESIIEAQWGGVDECYALIKGLLERGYGNRSLQMTVVTWQSQAVEAAEEIDPTHAGVHGLMGSVAKEYPKWSVRCVDLERRSDVPWGRIFQIPADEQGNMWVHRREQWYRQQLFPCESFPPDMPHPDVRREQTGSAAESHPREGVYRRGGVYVVIGGAGGLGELFSEHLIRKYRAQLVWIGRRAIDAQIERKLERLAAWGPAPCYLQADASDRASLQGVCEQVKQRYGVVHGVVHSALGVLDESLAQMSLERFREVLSSKVQVTVRLAQVFAAEALDFVLFFSSFNSFGKDHGKSGYSAGCAFQDAFAHQLRRECPCAVKVMNWGYWGEVGSGRALPQSSKNRLAQAGIAAIEAAEGLAALDRLLAGPFDQLALLKTTSHFAPLVAQAGAAGARLAGLSADLLRKRCTMHITNIVSRTLKISPQQIDVHEPLDTYGLDSILNAHLLGSLREIFTDLNGTLLFEHKTVASVVDHFLSTRRDELIRYLEVEARPGAGIGEAVLASGTVSAAAPQSATVGFTALASPPTNTDDGQRAETPRSSREIAIIGITGRFPRADTLEEYWENLKAARDCVTEIPPERWPLEGFYDSDPQEALRQGKSSCKWGGFISQVEQFDPLFFRISPFAAELMDPQERLFLETAWNLLEEAGLTRDFLQKHHAGRVGVYVGSTYHQYGALNSDILRQSIAAAGSHSAIANRVSSFFGLTGPSVAFDTMCSSAGTAIHAACNDLANGDCQLAIAGGVNLSIDPKKYIGLSHAHLVATRADSRCFGEGDGFLPAETVAAVLLKPLARALQDGDEILAVIKATAVNHSGRSMGYSVPDPDAEAQVMRAALARAGVDPRTITYVEAAANGSLLGDAIEFAALRKVFPREQTNGRRCAIGSVKGNTGHAEAASMMGQIAKVILQMQHRQLLPSINIKVPNPNIDFEDSAFHLQREMQEWTAIAPLPGASGTPRRALINAFGAGGSNVCMVLEESAASDRIRATAQSVRSERELVVLSGREPAALDAIAGRMLEFLAAHPEVNLGDLAHTLQCCKEAMQARLAFAVSSRAELTSQLERYLAARKSGGKLLDVPGMFAADLAELPAHIRQLASGRVGDSIMSLLLEERDLEKLALLWVQGWQIPWASLHRGDARRVKLPTYPFARERCWMEAPVSGRQLAPSADEPPGQVKEITVEIHATPRAAAEARVIQFLAAALKVMPGRITPHVDVHDLGVDSITRMRLAKDLEVKFGVVVGGRDLLEHRTAAALAEFVARQLESRGRQLIAAEVLDGASVDSESRAMDRRAADALEKFRAGSLDQGALERLIERGAML